jgi:hypothetical protein
VSAIVVSEALYYGRIAGYLTSIAEELRRRGDMRETGMLVCDNGAKEAAACCVNSRVLRAETCNVRFPVELPALSEGPVAEHLSAKTR